MSPQRQTEGSAERPYGGSHCPLGTWDSVHLPRNQPRPRSGALMWHPWGIAAAVLNHQTLDLGSTQARAAVTEGGVHGGWGGNTHFPRSVCAPPHGVCHWCLCQDINAWHYVYACVQ